MPRTKFEKILSDFNSEIAKQLRGKKKQTTIAKILGMTQPAISQYFNIKRGWGFVDDEFKQKLINILPTLDMRNPEEFRVEIIKIAIERFERQEN